MDINEGDSVSALKKKIKMESPRPLPPAPTLSLYRVPEGVGFTEPGVTVGAKDEISATSSLHGMFAENLQVQLIVRPPSKPVTISVLDLFLTT